ncbi:M15 family metallopeptidase [Paenibacillus cisolokensis]|uniref:M15 family metallopeptidase n=1 Tax=Paenibacillus cisolokensis TaxID=1658519 RepID=UPI003D2B9A8D
MVKRRKTTILLIAVALLAFYYMQIQTSIPGVLPELEWNKEEAPPITDLHPYVLEQKNKLVSRAKEQKISIIITDGFRSHEEQTRLYNQGRTTDGSIVTNARAGESYHNYGLAIDFALQLEDGTVIWDMEYDGNRNGKSDWMEVVSIAKDLGFHWGGDWTGFPDYPHLQIDFGLTIRELQRGERPPLDPEEYMEAAK